MNLLCAAVLAAALPAAAVPPGEYSETTTQEEINDFYQKNPDVAKIKKKYEDDVKRRAAQGQDAPLERALDEPEDENVAEYNAKRLASLNPAAYMQDLVEEYLVEKGQVVEENIWRVSLEKAPGFPAIQQLYRDYLKRAYFNGRGKDGDANSHLSIIRRLLDTQGGWATFPKAITGPVPPGAAATYGGWLVTMGPGVLDICVFSHELYHWTDDFQGGVDGEHSGPPPHPETHAYDQMCKEIS